MRVIRLVAAVLATLGAVGPSLAAQDQRIDADAAHLPADRIADLLALLSGVSQLPTGDLSIRGSGRNALGATVDGIPVTPGNRALGSVLLGGSWYGEQGSGMGLGTNALGSVELVSGPGMAEFAGSRGGVLDVRLRAAGGPGQRPVALRAAWATDAPLGTSHGLDFNRITFDADARAGRLCLMLSGALEGQGSVRLGQGQNAPPVYLADGIDTTVTLTSGQGATAVDVLRFRRSPGIRIPASASSRATAAARADYDVGAGHQVSFTLLASQAQARIFDYASLYAAQNLTADRRASRALTVSWRGPLRQREGSSLVAELQLSRQADHRTTGPLTSRGEVDTRAPWGGFLVAPLDFLFDGGNFPVDDALVRNFRRNLGRRSPYDLNNTTQYRAVDAYRNGPYGLFGFIDDGGPDGRLTLAEERRTVARAALQAGLRDRHELRLGVEATRYDTRAYSSILVSQVLSEAWVESPGRTALFADYRLTLKAARIQAGVRYDHFRSGASRPAFPRISTAPAFDPAHPTAGFIADQGHGALAPQLRAELAATPRLTVRGAIGRRLMAPDFNQLYSGLNTDLSVTGPGQAWGTDLGFERSTLGELGARYRLDDATSLDVAIWTRSDVGLVDLRLRSRFDPLAAQFRDLSLYQNSGRRSATGLDLSLARTLGGGGRAWVSYSSVNATRRGNATIPGLGSDSDFEQVRPHTLAAAVLYQPGADARSLGGLLRQSGVFAMARLAAGTAYTACPRSNSNDVSTLSGESCAGAPAGELNNKRLPVLALLDLRVTRRFHLGAVSLLAFADARNLLNNRNTLRVFAQNGRRTNHRERDESMAADLTSLAQEATRNGLLLSDSTMDLSFGGVSDPRGACGSWVGTNGAPAAPNCVYLIGAEERFGNGDHRFSVAEQRRASRALYEVGRGLQHFTGPGRRIRLGLEVQW